MELNASFTVHHTHRLRFTSDAFSPDNSTLADLIEPPVDMPRARVLAFIDQGVIDSQPDLGHDLTTYVADTSHVSLVGFHAVPGGEACKNDHAVFEMVCRMIHDAGLCRHSYVLAIGGGAVLDVVGLAAAMAHRGVRLIRMPTTTLSQGDAGVGVKNGINAFGKKNYLGTFAVPWAVVNDEQMLTSLSDRDWIGGFSEAVKVALIKDRALFEQIAQDTPALMRRELDTAGPIIRRSAQLHLEHITAGGDPFELATGRPLDFGHWSAHRLEQMTGFSLRHGEAVAIGLALDTTYSALAGHLAQTEADRILGVLARLGFALYDEAMGDRPALLEGLDEFREHLGGPLCLTLLEGIGKPITISRVDRNIVLAAIDQLATMPTVASVSP